MEDVRCGMRIRTALHVSAIHKFKADQPIGAAPQTAPSCDSAGTSISGVPFSFALRKVTINPSFSEVIGEGPLLGPDLRFRGITLAVSKFGGAAIMT